MNVIKHGWHKWPDVIPEDDRTVLVMTVKGRYHDAFYHAVVGKWVCIGVTPEENIAYWCELPE